MIALMLHEAMKGTHADITALNLPAGIQQPQDVYIYAPLHRMANRIARNREVLGLHYPTDRIIGETLAIRSHALLVQCPIVKRLVAKARTEEWI